MLKALYDYAVKNDLVLPPGFVNKPIRAYILLAEDGHYLGIEQCEDEVLPCPDIGSMANSKDKCNILAEKLSCVVVAPQAGENVKNQFFRQTLRDGASAEPKLALCLRALEDQEVATLILVECKKRKLKGMDRISFKVGGRSILKSPALSAWWSEYRKQFTKNNGQPEMRCMITGEPTIPLATVPPVTGLAAVGGHPRGDALICFDKSAFCSYGLKQAANAPVSETAFAAVKAALDDLLAGAPAMYQRKKADQVVPIAPIFAGIKFVHWYDEPIALEEDAIQRDLIDFEDEDEEEDEEDVLTEAEQQAQERQREAQANAAADRLVKSVQTGEHATSLSNRYHILLLSGANGRVMVRHYENGSYETLQKNLAQWEADLKLVDDWGTQLLRPRKLSARLSCLMKYQQNDNKPFERMKKELAGLTPTIILSILHNTPLPDEVAVRALATIRSKMVQEEEEQKKWPSVAVCCQWLKVWLLRKHRARNEEEHLMPYYHPDMPSAAYHCGALVAIYTELQKRAMPDIGAGIAQRYYASASRTPKLVLGQLERMAKIYLEKLDSPAAIQGYEDHLNEVSCFFTPEHPLPSALNLEEQSYFALGYRQMSAQLTKERLERIAAAEQKKAQKKEGN